MTKKKVIIIAGLIVSVGVLVGILFFNRERLFPKKETQKDIEVPVTPTPKEELVLWDDPAGFSFQYPKSLTVNKHEEDQENYAHIEFTHPNHKGGLIVWEKDTTAPTIAQWLKNEKTLSGATSIDTTLGGNEAKKVIVKEPKLKQVTATLDEDVVIYIETTLETPEYWQNVNDTIIGSFKLSVSQIGSTDNQSAAQEEAPSAEADEEESVE